MSSGRAALLPRCYQKPPQRGLLPRTAESANPRFLVGLGVRRRAPFGPKRNCALVLPGPEAKPWRYEKVTEGGSCQPGPRGARCAVRTRRRPPAPREPKAGQTRPRDGIDAGDSTRWIHLRAVGYPQPILLEQAGGLGRAGLHPAARPSPPPLPRGPLAFTGERAQGLRYGPELATFVKG